MKRVLVTGATGFIGRNVVTPLIEHDFEIHAICRDVPPGQQEGVSWHSADLMNAKDTGLVINRVMPSHLLHLAWYAEHGLFWNSEENLRWVEASLNLLRCFVHAGGKRVVMAGTCAEYDWHYGCCVENTTPCRPNSLYGTSKLALQAIAEAYCDLCKVSFAWGRIFHLFGPHENENRFVPALIKGLIDSKRVDCTEGTQLRDYMHVTDVANAFISLLDSNVDGVVNVASGHPLTLHDLADKIMNYTGQQGRVNFGARPIPESEPSMLIADVSRLNNEVGWKPRLQIDEAIREIVDWWRQTASEDNG